MVRLARTVLAVLATAGVPVAAAAHANAAAYPKPGTAAPPFRLFALDGRTIVLSRFRGRPLFINFFASWCPPCRSELPRILAAHARYGARVAFLGVDTQEPEAVARRFVAQERLDFPVGIDRGQMAVTYGANPIPESVFIGRDGRVRDVVAGAIPPARLRRALAALAGGA